MSVLEDLKSSARELISDVEGFGVPIKLVAPDTTTVDINGNHSKHHIEYDTEGNLLRSKTARITVSEADLIAASYPYRDGSGEVYLKDHRVTVKDSTGVDKEYVIDTWFPDETLGVILIFLSDYGDPLVATPTNLSISLSSTSFIVANLTWIDNTLGDFDTYEIFRKEENGAFVFLDSTTNPTSFTDSTITGSDETKCYEYKVRAKKGSTFSGFSNEFVIVIDFVKQAGFQELLDVFPNALAAGEQEKLKIVFSSGYDLGVWDNITHFAGWFLTDSVNRLTYWIGGKTATAVNSPAFNSKGVLHDGSTNYINENITPSEDLIIDAKNDIHIETYVYENLDTTTSRYLFGQKDSSNHLSLLQSPAVNSISFLINGPNQSNFVTTTGLFLDKTRYGIHRDSAGIQQLFINGTSVHSESDASVALPTNKSYVGARNLTGSAANHINARQSYKLWGMGFDLVKLDTWLNLVETTFGLDV